MTSLWYLLGGGLLGSYLIGRIYLVRGPKPTVQEQWKVLLGKKNDDEKSVARNPPFVLRSVSGPTRVP